MVHVLTFPELGSDRLFRIMEARSRVFIMEQRITACPVLDEVDLHRDSGALIDMAYEVDLHCLHVFMDNDAGEILAYARCFSEEPGKAHIGRVLTTVRGKGYGVRVMKEAIRACRERLSATEIALSSQEQVVGFYEKLGFSVVSGPYDECGIRHYGMELN